MLQCDFGRNEGSTCCLCRPWTLNFGSVRPWQQQQLATRLQACGHCCAPNRRADRVRHVSPSLSRSLQHRQLFSSPFFPSLPRAESTSRAEPCRRRCAGQLSPSRASIPHAPTLIASPRSSSVPSRARPRPIPAGIDTPRHQTPLKFRRNSGRRRTPPSGHRFHQPTAEIDSPRLPKAHALLVLARSRCFRARSTAMPSMACCCSSRAARTRPCAAPPSTPSPSGPVEPSHGRPITNQPRRRRGHRRHRRSCCCTADALPPTIPGSNSCFDPAQGEPLVLPHHSSTAGTAFPHRNRAP